MSNVTTVAAKKQTCGHLYEDVPRDVMGGQVNLQISGTDVNISGVKTGSSITVGTGNYSPGVDANGLPCTNPDGTFRIFIEKVGIFFVNLQDGSDFIITSVQSTAYLGKLHPAKLISVNVGTTGDFSVAY